MTQLAIVAAITSLIGIFAATSVAGASVSAETPGNCKNTGDYLTSFSCGKVVTYANGTTIRKFNLLVEENHFVPITMGNQSIPYPAWTFNSTVPGPTLRMDEGDTVWITVTNSPQSKHHHSLHMHSVHDPSMDGTSGKSSDIAPGQSFTYQFVAGPSGLYPYHCHFPPIQDHINRGLYGAMIIDPKTPRPAAVEMVMLMNGYDLDLNPDMIPTNVPPNYPQAGQIMYPNETATAEEDSEEEEGVTPRPELDVERDNEIYTVNSKAFEYMVNPIQIKLGEPVRVYLLNMVEFDPVNNFHLHAGMFNYTESGTANTQPVTTDIVTLSQGDRGVLEFTPEHLGNMMFHSHINEFADLGWMSSFEVVR